MTSCDLSFQQVKHAFFEELCITDSVADRPNNVYSTQNQPAPMVHGTFILYLQWYAPLRP